jgi:ubiquinone/menaquinone biosynthesis C-methylase UbiE
MDDREVRDFNSSPQFNEGSQEYIDRYTDYDYFESLLYKGIPDFIKNNKHRPIKILEIGCGAGNMTIPILRTFKNCDLIATDLSKPLLDVLEKELVKYNYTTKIEQKNIMKLDYPKESFDLIIGAAILHHLYEPNKVIEQLKGLLTPDGYAMFFEPFETGNGIVKMIYREIVSDVRSPYINPIVLAFLYNQIQHLDISKITPKTKEIFGNRDDKWIFTKWYFNALSEKTGLELKKIVPAQDLEKQFEEITLTYLKHGCKMGKEGLPEWAWDKIKFWDKQFSVFAKDDLLIEGCIVYKK